MVPISIQLMVPSILLVDVLVWFLSWGTKNISCICLWVLLEAEKIHICLFLKEFTAGAYTAKFLKQNFVNKSCFLGKKWNRKFCSKLFFLHWSMHILQILLSYNFDCLCHCVLWIYVNWRHFYNFLVSPNALKRWARNRQSVWLFNMLWGAITWWLIVLVWTWFKMRLLLRWIRILIVL